MLIYWRVSLVYHTVPPLLQDYNKALVIIDAAPGGVPPREEQNKMLEFKEDLDGCEWIFVDFSRL